MILYSKLKPVDVYNIALVKDKSNGNPALRIVSSYGVDMNTLADGFAIHLCNNFLKELVEYLGLDVDVKFETYSQYGELIFDIDLLLMWDIIAELTERGEYCNTCEA